MNSSPEKSSELSTIPPKPSPGFVLRFLTENFFSKVKIEKQWLNIINELSSKGKVVYIHRLQSIIDFLCLEYITKNYNLPSINFISGIGYRTVKPLKWLLLSAMNRYRKLKDELHLKNIILNSNETALLFLKQPPRIFQETARDFEIDYLYLLIKYQKMTQTPLFLIPQIFFWGRRMVYQQTGIVDKILGSRQWPGWIRTIGEFLRSYKESRLVWIEPINLLEFIENNKDISENELVTQLKFLIMSKIETERKIVLGPLAKSPEKIRQEVFNYPEMEETIEKIAKTEKKSTNIIRRKADKILKEIAAKQSIFYLTLLDAICWWIWNRIFDGIEIDEQGLKKVKQAAREGTLILLPTHKSHVDYLILSQIFCMQGLIPPHITSGINLSFWPLGRIFRGCGAFFIRRSFKGDKLYTNILKSYLKKLIQEGYPIEFFIEGSRSRTGKVLNPKFGMLGMVFDIAKALKGRKIYFCPISVNYDRVIEDKSYQNELEGGEKKGEGLGSIIKSRHTLRSKYGRIDVQFAKPFSFDEFLNFNNINFESELDENQRKSIVTKLGYRITYEMNRVVAITTGSLVATALLTTKTRGLIRSELEEWVKWLLVRLNQWDCRLTTVLKELKTAENTMFKEVVEQTLNLFISAGIVSVYGEGEEAIYTIEEKRRIQLCYYKNNLINFFAPFGMLSLCLVSLGKNRIELSEIEEKIILLSRLLKYEFSFKYDATINENILSIIKSMQENKEIELGEDDKVVLLDNIDVKQNLLKYALIIEEYVEAYYTALLTIEKFTKNNFSSKEFIKTGLLEGQRLYLTGKIEKIEARNKHILQNSLSALKDMGIIESIDDNYKISSMYENEKFKILIEDIYMLLTQLRKFS